jgi:hypothetical protein
MTVITLPIWVKNLIICSIIFIFGLLIGGGSVGYIVYNHYLKALKITWVNEVTKTVYVSGGKEKPSLQCGDIWIKGKQDKLKFNISAGDQCKSASRELKVSIPILHHSFGPWVAGMIGYDNNIQKLTSGYAVGARYLYSWRLISIGPGLGYFKISNIQGVIITADATLHF